VLEVLTITRDDFAVAAHCEGRVITASLKGNADHAAVELVEVLLDRIHTDARTLDVNQVVIDLRQLEFMNSSCFRHFIGWIATIQELDQGRRYDVKFLSKPSYHWQRRSLQSLRSFAVDLISVVEDR
jgi:anti-anti-sigma factor